MFYLKNTITNYINNSDPYALQINGEWGVGKTFFINDFFKNESKIKSVYFSVSGYNSLQELKKELLLSIAIKLDEKSIVKYGNHALSIFKRFNLSNKLVLNSIAVFSDTLLETYKNSKLVKNNGKLVIILDDFERLSPNIDYQDLLGFISTEIINNFKILIISNENQIKDKEKFLLIKEKIISKTVDFSRDESILKDIIYNNTRSDFLSKNVSWLLEIISTYTDLQKINLRTIFSIIYNFEFIENKLKENPSKLDKNYREEYLKSILLNIFVIVFEIKSGNFLDRYLYQMKTHDFDNMFYIFGKNDPENYWHYLITQYHKKNKEFDEYIIYSNTITSYVVSGLWVEDNYRQNWYRIFYPNSTSSNFNKLRDFYYYSDEELIEIQTSVLSECYDDILSLDQILDRYFRLNYLKTKNLLLIEESALNNILKVLSKKIDNTQLSEYELNNLQEQLIMNQIAIDEDSRIRIESLLKEKEKQLYTEMNLNLFEAIINDDYNKENSIYNELPSKKIKIFKIILSNNLLESHIITKNNRSYLLSSFINRRYLKISNSYEYHQDEINDVEKLITKINELRNKQELGKVDSYNINVLLERLEQLLKHWKKQ